MSSEADVTIKNLSNQQITTEVTRDYWVEKDGATINGKIIKPGETKTFQVAAKTGHHGELDINLIGKSSLLVGKFLIGSIKDPQDSGALKTESFQDSVKLTTRGSRYAPYDKKLRLIELDIADQPSITSGWDIVFANQKGVVNAQLMKLYNKNLLPHKFDQMQIGCPQIDGGNSLKQDAVIISLPLKGSLKGVTVDGNALLTINLNDVNVSLAKNADATYTLTIDLSKENILLNVDLSNAKLTPKVLTKTIETTVRDFVNALLKKIKPFSFTLKAPVPLSLDQAIVKLAFVENAANKNRSFLAVLGGLQGNKGTYNLSQNVIYNSPNSTSAVVFSNALFMTFCEEMLNRFMGEDFGFEIADDNPYLIYNQFKKVLSDGGFFGINAKINKQDFTVELSKKGVISGRVILKYQTTKLLPWSAVKLNATVTPTAANGQLSLKYTASGKGPLWLWAIFPPLALIIEIFANGNGVINLTIPGFYVDQVSMTGNVQISGKLTE